MSDRKDINNARAEMELAKQQSEKKFASGPKRPQRYKIYDKIKEKVSVKAIDAVIIISAAAIIVLLVVGIITGKPQK